MKFTKQQLLDTLKAKLTANGKHLSISEKTIKSLSDSHFDLLVGEDTELDDLVKKILLFLKQEIKLLLMLVLLREASLSMNPF